jgi:hypothetical protein
MLRRFASPILVLGALGILFSGPVAACVCADEPVAPMPCCPEDGGSAGHADHGVLPDVDRACDPQSADALRPGSPDLPQPVVFANELPFWHTSDAPAQPPLVEPAPYNSPPIYLLTLRLRN